MRIIGIDPGSISCGYGIIEETNSNISIINFGIIKPRLKSRTSKFSEVLKILYDDIFNLLIEFNIEEAAIETQFYHKNAQSLMKLTQARTSITLAVLNLNLPIYEYSPREIKQSVTSNGNATKKSVRFMVNSILNINIEKKLTDASDALAVALCHVSKKGKLVLQKNSPRNWREFIEMNPERIIS
ncbi:MAG: crossover junction endodeoxyribonuclease RuvC [Ignavibacteria bacterium]|nr:crossover junction endodeoxyribonuclease RuvC [Ignavibacteria bacterium]